MTDEHDREPDELVEQVSTGASVSLDITRGTGTRDQEKWKFKGKGETADEAADELEILLRRAGILDPEVGDDAPVADRVRQFDPDREDENDDDG